MKLRILISLGLLSSMVMMGCAGADADLEKARYLLGKGDAASGQEAFELVDNLILTEKGENLAEAYRLYAGAQMSRAGLDGISLMAVLVHKEDSDDPIKVTRDAISFTTASAGYLADGIAKLTAYVVSADFTSLTNTRTQNGIRFQLGLINFVEALRITYVASGLTNVSTGSKATITQDSCERDLKKARDNSTENLNAIDTDIKSSKADFIASGLDATHALVRLAQDLDDQVPDSAATYSDNDIESICTYLVLHQ